MYHDHQNEEKIYSNDEAVQENTSTDASSSKDNQELIACQQEVAVWKDRYLRINADLENMRRRMAKDHEASLIAAQSDIFSDLLAIVDNFDRALADQNMQDNSACKSWFEGIALIRNQLANLLSSYGVEEITQIQTFDPELHEALAQVQTADYASGDIVQVLQKGYMFKNRVLRHAKVTVSR